MALDVGARLGRIGGRASAVTDYVSRAGALGLLALVVIALPIWRGNSWTVNFSIAANPAGSPARVGSISVRGPTFTITQAAPAAGGQ